MENKKEKIKIGKKGKYLLLFMAAIIFSAVSIGITVKSYNDFSNKEPQTSADYTYSNVDTIQKMYPDKESDVSSAEEDSKQVVATITSPIEGANAVSSTDTPKIVEKKAELIFHKPIDGTILKGYAKDELVYSKTAETWMTHEGIDIKSEMGSAISSIESGTVESIKNDPLYGITIIVDHGDGYKSIYSNLASDKMAVVGQKVDRGQVIGGVGNTASIEVLDESHLHFELYKDGVSVNCEKLLGY